MTKPMTQDHEARRAARIAAARAARTTAPEWVEMSVPVTELRAGDYLVRVPAQHGYRGARYEATLAAAFTVHAGQRIADGAFTLVAGSGGVVPVAYRQNGSLFGSSVWPATHTAIVRRPA